MRPLLIGTLSALLCAALAPPRAAAAEALYLGADLSFANEMEDCGGHYREHGQDRDIFEMLHAHGANLVRVRLWNHATWTKYSNLEDVSKTIRRARAAGMQVLLDFHYSDDWADGDKQIIPAAWSSIQDPQELAQALYQYTFDTLSTLKQAGLMPDMVQVGNEINQELLGTAEWGAKKRPIDWPRNALLINAGIRAIRDAGADASPKPLVMLHIAQPENVAPWLAEAVHAGVRDFDLVGISYYSKWSKYSFAGLGTTLKWLVQHYRARFLVAETGYPWTLDRADASPNLLGQDALIAGYPATPAGQRQYMIDLTQTVVSNGGIGVIYWAPDWISTSCKTRWGQGSSWENATFFDFHHRDELLPVADFLNHTYVFPAPADAPAFGKP
jgi:arabinogalactan endo-1,4-beta-galactosidase